jgi:hypothetical protein
MNIDDTVERIIRKNPRIQQAVENDPSLRNKLSDIVEENYTSNSTLLNWAKFNDKANRILGPLEAGLRYLSPLGSIGFGIYSAAKLLHYGLLKLPYAVYYAAKTHDVKGTLALTLAEVAKYVTPFGGVGDVLPLYQKTIESYVIRNSAKKLEDYIGTCSEAREPALQPALALASGRRSRIKVPRKLTDQYRVVVDGRKARVNVPSPRYKLRVAETDDGAHELYLVKNGGIYPNVYSTSEVDLPDNVRELRLPKQGFLKMAA